MKQLLYFLFLLISANGYSQSEGYGASLGVSFSIGNKVNRVGFRAASYYHYGFIQVNSSLTAYYNFNSLAVRKKTPELQFGLGVQFGMGKLRTSNENRYVSLTDNNTLYFSSIGYSYLHYWDRQETTQGGGIFNINIENFTLATQNDILGFGSGWRDRFRTAAVLVQYRYLDTKFGLNTTFWTGDFSDCKTIDETNYPARFGYKEQKGAKYGKFSLGLLSLQVEQVLPYTQIARVNVGLDSEKVRHTVQNKFAHDQYYTKEKSIKYKQKHYPMLDENGNQYLFEKNQKIKPATFYYNISLNNGVFY